MKSILISRNYIKPDFVIESNSNFLLENIKAMYSPFVYEKASCDKEFFFISAKTANEGYLLSYKERTLHADSSDVLQIMLNIIYENSYSHKNHLLIHAGAVGLGGKAYIFPADTLTGKSTLTVYLCSKGFDYVTDDVTVIDRSSLSVQAYRKDIMLRKGGIDVLKGHGINVGKLKEVSWGNHTKYPYVDLKRGMADSYEIGGIIFLARNEGNVNTFNVLNPEAGFIKLIKSCLFYETTDMDKLNIIKRIISFGCYSLNFSDLRYVEDVLHKVNKNE